jgi:hypothetical protein
MEKAEINSIKKSIREAVKKDDEKSLFDALSLFNADQQFKCLGLIYNNQKLYKKVFKHVVNQLDSLSAKNKSELKHITLNCSFTDYELFKELGEYYCNKTNDLQDRIYFIELKCKNLIDEVNLNKLELENSVNQLFDLLMSDRPGNRYHWGSEFHYFDERLEALVYLSNDRLEKLLNDPEWHIPQKEILKYLEVYRPQEEIELYLNKCSEIGIGKSKKNKI